MEKGLAQRKQRLIIDARSRVLNVPHPTCHLTQPQACSRTWRCLSGDAVDSVVLMTLSRQVAEERIMARWRSLTTPMGLRASLSSEVARAAGRWQEGGGGDQRNCNSQGR